MVYKKPRSEPTSTQGSFSSSSQEDTIEGRNPVLEALKANRPINKLLLAKDIGRHSLIGQILHHARQNSILVEYVDSRFIQKLSSTGHSQGVIALVASKDYVDLNYLLEVSLQREDPPLYIILDGIEDPQNLAVKLSVNGTVMQDFNTDDMAHSISRCIEWTSSIHALEPGDILATGTNHRGLSAFQDGDKVDLEIEGIGCLSINISDDLKRTWSRDTRLEHAEKGLEGPHTPQLTGKYAP